MTRMAGAHSISLFTPSKIGKNETVTSIPVSESLLRRRGDRMGGNTDLTTGERGGVGDRRLRRLRLAEAGWGVCICRGDSPA